MHKKYYKRRTRRYFYWANSFNSIFPSLFRSKYWN